MPGAGEQALFESVRHPVAGAACFVAGAVLGLVGLFGDGRIWPAFAALALNLAGIAGFSKGLEDRDRWLQLVDRHNAGQINPEGDQREGNYEAETFSFHPWSVCTDDKKGNVAGIIATRGSCVDYNALEADQDPFERWRERGPQPDVTVWRLHATQVQQERLYENASASRNLNNQSRMSGDIGSYALLTNNCGSWARHMIESSGLTWPAGASEHNLGGTGVGGIQDELPFASVVGAAAQLYGCTAGRFVQETGGEYFIEAQGDDGIKAGVRWTF